MARLASIATAIFVMTACGIRGHERPTPSVPLAADAADAGAAVDGRADARADAAVAEPANGSSASSDGSVAPPREEDPDVTHCLIFRTRPGRTRAVVARLERLGIPASATNQYVQVTLSNRKISEWLGGRVTIQCGPASWSNTGQYRVCIPTLEGASVPRELAPDVISVSDGYKICE